MLNLVVQLATVASVLATAVTIWITGKLSRRQMNAQLFVTYTQRYESIMSGYPEDALPARFNSDTSLPPESEVLTLYVLRYLNLASEEYYLWKRKYIDHAVWMIWEHEIRRTLASPLMLREWSKIEHEFTSYPEFIKFVEDAQAQALSSSIIAGSPLGTISGDTNDIIEVRKLGRR
ncbi:MAG TPA: hypothetical protein VKT32_04865 [Chthonomonadaceae bacterium]|nr:hypothetical protein [Chthonomonadaceae bacterium]